MDFLEPYGSQDKNISKWMTSHRARIEDAFKAVASIYAEKASGRIDGIRRVMAAADPDWAAEGTLSQKALRAVRSTSAVSCALVGMRREEYVSDVLTELRRPVTRDNRLESWRTLSEELANMAL